MKNMSFFEGTLLGATLALPPRALGQGAVSFSTAGAFISTNSVHGGPSTGLTWASSVSPDAYYYALLVAPTNVAAVDTSLLGWTFTGNYATNSSAGRLWGNYATDTGGVVIPGYAPGATANFVVVGWSSNVGHEWTAVAPLIQTGAIGTLGSFALSHIGANVIVSGGASPLPVIMGNGGPDQIPGFTLDAPIPEPATGLLSGLGTVAVCLARRKRSVATTSHK